MQTPTLQWVLQTFRTSAGRHPEPRRAPHLPCLSLLNCCYPEGRTPGSLFAGKGGRIVKVSPVLRLNAELCHHALYTPQRCLLGSSLRETCPLDHRHPVHGLGPTGWSEVQVHLCLGLSVPPLPLAQFSTRFGRTASGWVRVPSCLQPMPPFFLCRACAHRLQQFHSFCSSSAFIPVSHNPPCFLTPDRTTFRSCCRTPYVQVQ